MTPPLQISNLKFTNLGTGEAWWVKRMVAEHHEAAVAAGVKVVHCCGYDSIPSDLGAQAVAEYIRSTHDR